MLGPQAKDIRVAAEESCRLASALEPLMNVLGYLTEVIRFNGPVVARVADHRLADGRCFVLHQHELHGLPGIILDSLDDDGAVWLRVDHLKAIEPPPVEPDLGVWIDVSDDPDRPPSIRDSIVVTVDGAERERLIAAEQARAADLTPAIEPDRQHDVFNARLRLADHPGLAVRLEAYVAGPWTWWARTERLRRRTMAIHARLSDIAPFGDGTDRSCDIVWGIGVSRRRHKGREISLPVLQRLVTIEVGGDREIRVRPRPVGAIADLQGFETARAGAPALAVDSARRILEAIERDGEVSPFAPASFEPILRAVGPQLDPRAIRLASGQGPPGPGEPLSHATEHLVVSDRWVIFARPRTASLLARDIERFKDALDRIANGDGEIPMLARALAPGASDDPRAGMRPALSGVIGGPIDIESAAERASGELGDLFFPLPCSEDQIDLVRRLQRSDGLVAQVAPGSAKVQAIVNVVCHHLALGLRVLVASPEGATLRAVRDTLPSGIRDLTIWLTGNDREQRAHVEAAVRRLQQITETLKPRDHVGLINRAERDVIATRRAIMDLDEEFAGIAGDAPGLADLPFDVVHQLVAESDADAWFEDRPQMLVAETGMSLASIDAARDARLRLGSDLRHIDDEIPPAALLPDPATVARMHQDLVQLSAHGSTGSRELTPARRVVAALDARDAGLLAADLKALAAAHRVIADEPWLGPLSPLGNHHGGGRADVAALVDFARDATSQLSRRAAFLARPVETPADAFADTELLDIVDRLSAGKKVFTAFTRRERRGKSAIDAIMVAGFAPAGPDGWAHVRDYLAWRRDVHALGARWRSLAPELGAPSPAADYPQSIHGFERIARSVDVAVVTATIARRNVFAVAGPMMSPGAIDALLGDAGELRNLGAGVRAALTEREASRADLTRLEQLFAGTGALAAWVRDDVLSRIGQDGTDTDCIQESWTRVRERIVSLHNRHADFEHVDAVSKALAEAGAPILARRARTEAALPSAGDHVLGADWPGAWDRAVLARRMEGSGQDQRLRQLAARRRALEATLREQLEAVVVARTQFALVQGMSGPIRQALTIFMIALRKVEAAADGFAAQHHRRTAREALGGCCEGIPCWIVPSWRVAEQVPARLDAFDLVIFDEASRSDVGELTTLLRGRKIVVIGDDKQASPALRNVDHAELERLGDAFLRPLPKKIRPFMRPGSSLHDLAKVIFPGNHCHLREPVRIAGAPIRTTSRSADERPIALASSAAGALHDKAIETVHELDEPRKLQQIAHSEADVIVDEIAKAVPRLLRSNRLRRTGAVPRSAERLPIALDEAPIESPPIADDAVMAFPATASAAAVGEAAPASADLAIRATRPEQRVVAISPQPRDGFPDAEPQRSVSGRGVAVAAVVMLVTVVAAACWLLGPRLNSRSAASGSVPILREFTPLAAAKSSDRVGNGGQRGAALEPRHEAAAAPPKSVRTVRFAPQIASADRSATGASLSLPPVEQRAVLYEEDPADPNGKRYTGGVTWHTERIPSAPGAPSEVVVKADLNVPDAKTTMAMTFRRNTDQALSASHVVDIKVDMPRDTPYGEIDKVRGLVMKQGERVRGAQLEAEAAKVTAGYFMVALASGAQQLQHNLKLLKDNSWFDVMIVYHNGSRAILAIDKGASGEQAFKEAFAAWGQ